MTELILLILSLAIVLALVLAIVVVLKNGKFHFFVKKDKEKDALLVEAEHQDNFDKWLVCQYYNIILLKFQVLKSLFFIEISSKNRITIIVFKPFYFFSQVLIHWFLGILKDS